MHPRLISCVELVARVAHLLVAWPLAAKISFESDDVEKLHESYTSEDELIFFFQKIDRISACRLLVRWAIGRQHVTSCGPSTGRAMYSYSPSKI